MRYTIYKVVNLLNGKFYIGKHQTLNPTDSYLGSGRAIRAAIKLHGPSNFVKEILFDFDSEEHMNSKERELVTEKVVLDPMSYNMAVGGEGGPHFKGRKHSKASIQQRSNTRGPIVVSEANRKRLSEANLARGSLSEETRMKIAEKARGRKHSTETKAKIAESLRLKKLKNDAGSTGGGSCRVS